MEESESIFTITPMSQKLSLSAGEVYDGVITVFNPMNAKSDFPYQVTVSPYSVMGEEYSADFATQSDNTMIVDWITIDEPYGVLKPNERHEIHYTVTVPEDAPGGGQYATIMVGLDMRDAQSSDSVNIKNTYEMASIIYAKISGDIVRSGEIQQNGIPGFITALPITLSSEFTNNGNIHETAEIDIKIKNFLTGATVYPADGATSAFEEVIMPNTSRYVTRDVQDISPLGIYEVTQNINYMGQTTNNTQLMIACPIWFMLLIVIVLGLIIFGIVKLTSKHRRRRKVI